MITRDYRRLLIYLIGVTTGFRLIYINLVPLVPQEAYYWKYAKHLALSYLDHPPLTAYTIAFFTWIGGDNVFFVRLGAVIFSTGLAILGYAIANRLFKDQRWALVTVLTMNCTIIFSVGSVIITPDVPLLFFWALSVYSLVRLQESAHCKWWYLAGVGVGLGLLSKYSAILIVPGIFMHVLLSRSQRKWLLTVHPYLGLAVACLIFSPVIVWNYQNDWASLVFQFPNRFSHMTRLGLDHVFQLFLTQLGLLTPYVFFFTFIGWFQAGWLSVREHNEKYSLLFWMASPVYVIFGLASLTSLVKMNWLAPAYITSIIAGIVWLNSARTKLSSLFRRCFRPGLILGLGMVLLTHLLPVTPILPMRRDDTWTGWKELAAHVMRIKQEMGEGAFIFSHEYGIPSEITFHTPDHEPTYSREIIGEDGLQYDYWTNTGELIGRNAIFVTGDAHRYRNIDRIRESFDLVEEAAPLKIVHGGRVFRIFYIYRCYGYTGPAS
ncbi:MAG: glycosyltransferase family 39 protein [Candidatus Eisenbacteria bacterium]